MTAEAQNVMPSPSLLPTSETSNTLIADIGMCPFSMQHLTLLMRYRLAQALQNKQRAGGNDRSV